MEEKEYPSSSDESDADFVPKEEDYKSESDSETSDIKDSEDEDKNKKSIKRKKGNKKVNKRAKTVTKGDDDDDKGDDEDEKTENKEEKKIDIDALWADFKKDVNNAENKKTAESSNTSKVETTTENKPVGLPQNLNQNNTALKPRVFSSFPNKSKVGGLSKVLNQIGKKDKMSTLQKSQLDWNKFKKSEGIEEEIKTYNRGKDGYLDKQDFLQRTDLRQFEIEKELRSARRKF